PEFELPALEGIEVTRPVAEVTEADVDQGVERWRGNFATQETVEEPAVIDDLLTVNLTFEVEGAEKHEHADATVAVRAQAIEGIPLETLGEKLTGAKPGDTVSVETTIPDGFPKEDQRGKKATFTFAVKAVKRTRLPELDDAFATRFGFDNVAAFRDWLRERIKSQSKQQQQQAMRQQVYDYLHGKVQIELPAGALGRMKDRTLLRRANDLMMRGVPRAEIEKHVDELAVSAGEEAQHELKTLFIMQRVAEELKVQVSEQEVNALISQMAAQYNRRPDSVRDDLEKRDGLVHLYQQIGEQKAIDLLLEKAKITDAPPAEAKDEKK
ncbi:MAG: trigger factor, partial [Phycisphaerae bacterium]|nr:trigger factor [Phycisphaerae bacterium]